MILDLKFVMDGLGFSPKGVIHIGGHHGQEAEFYQSLGVKDALFFEPMKESYEICKSKVEPLGYACRKTALGATNGKVEMYTETSNQGQSSSVLKPKLHSHFYPSILFDGREEVPMTTLDEAMSSESGEYDMINIDVQGYELEVLKGASKTLEGVSLIYSEVNDGELYEGCALVEDLDKYLISLGFTRESTVWTAARWGDAVYFRNPTK
jgi:FkbM family methyltransferase